MPLPRTCPVCGEPASRLERHPDGAVSCGGCGERFDPHALAARRTVAPGVLLTVTGGVSLAFSALLAFALFAAWNAGELWHPDRDWTDIVEEIFLCVGLPLLSSVMSVMMLVGGSHLRHRRNWRLAVVGAVCACLPSSCCFFPLGIFAGTWALGVLFEPAVKAAFR